MYIYTHMHKYMYVYTRSSMCIHLYIFWPQALHTGVSMALSEGVGGDAKGAYYQLSFTEDYMRVHIIN